MLRSALLLTLAALSGGSELVPEVSARVWMIPSEVPTVQAGVDSAAVGDTVLVVCGTYYEHSISLKAGITLRSETGEAGCVVIDAGGQGRLLDFTPGGDGTSVEGITLTGGRALKGGAVLMDGSAPEFNRCVFVANRAFDGPGGGAVYCGEESSPVFRECVFRENSAGGDGSHGGGAVRLNLHGSPTFDDCEFAGNSVQAGRNAQGGAVYFDECAASFMGCEFRDNSVDGLTGSRGGAVYALGYSSIPGSFAECTFSGNRAELGGGVYAGPFVELGFTGCTFASNSAGGGSVLCAVFADLELANALLAFNLGGEASLCSGGTVVFTCSDIFGNPGGDWTGCAGGQWGLGGNFSGDPLFCDLTSGDLQLEGGSPCLPGNHPAGVPCGLIGAWGSGCAAAPVDERPRYPVTWGTLRTRLDRP